MKYLVYFIAILLDKKFVLMYPDGMKTRQLSWEYARPLQQIHGGTFEVIWKRND